MYKRDPQQVAKYYLRQWGYLERNSHALDGLEKIKAVTFFKVLKSLESSELSLLAERYYYSTDYAKYNELVGDYGTVRTVPYDVMASKLNRSPKELQVELKAVQRKLGETFLRVEAIIEREQAIENIQRLEGITVELLHDHYEKEILHKAFQEIANYRHTSETDIVATANEMEQLKVKGYF